MVLVHFKPLLIDTYVIYPKGEEHNMPRCDMPWIPIKSLSSNIQDQKGYKLEVGDKLKLGRQILKVLEIVARKPCLAINSELFPFAYVFQLSSILTKY